MVKRPRNQKQVLAGLDLMNGRTIGRMAKSHDRGVVAPLRSVIGAAKSNEGLLRRLNAALFKRMDASTLETAMADGMVQSAMIGRVSAEPTQTSKRQKVKTSK